MKATLVVIYNHQYNENIPRINSLYEGRFDRIIHLVPFYEGNLKDVVAVYESSHFFQSFVSQAASTLSTIDSEHFLFIGDDVFLNPKIDQYSYFRFFGVQHDSNFLPELLDLKSIKNFWMRSVEALRFTLTAPGLQIGGLIPDYKRLNEQMSKHGIISNAIPLKSVLEKVTQKDFKFFLQSPIRGLRNIYGLTKRNTVTLFTWIKKKGKSNFPLAGGYSDVFVVCKNDLPTFATYAGIFAATRLFVELAVPTSLALASKKIITEKSLKFSGRAYWDDEINELDIHQNSIDRLIENFPEAQLYIHPIKLSKWS